MPVPEGVTGLVFLRRQDLLFHIDAEGQTQFSGSRIKILHPNALQLGNIALQWNPSAGTPVIHSLRIYRGSTSIDVLATSSFEVLRREGQLETGKLTGFLTAVLNVPDLRVGDELEIDFSSPTRDPVMGSSDAGLLILGPTPPAGRILVGLSWADGQEPRIQMAPEMAAVAKKEQRSVSFSFDNPKALNAPKDAPARYHWLRTVEYSDFSDWAALSRFFAPLYETASALGAASELKSEAKQIAAAYSTPMERAAAALRLVQKDVRYVYVGLNGGNLKPTTADETWARRYGDCKAKTVLLLALLRELGIEAEPVFANNSGVDDGLNERLPSISLFDHVLVRARIDDKTYYLDGTFPPVVPPALAPSLPYQWILPVTTKGAALENLPFAPALRPDLVDVIEIDARKGFDEPATIINLTITRGLDGLQQQFRFSGLGPGELLNSLRQEMTGSFFQTVDDVQWRYDEKAQASILKVTGTGIIPWDDDGDGARSYSLPGGGFSPPERRVRPADQDAKLPYYRKPEFECRVTTVRLPSTTSARQWSFNKGFDTHIFGTNYYRAFEIRAGAIRMVRGYRVEQPEIDAAMASRDNARIASFDNSMANIFFDPAGKVVPVSGSSVPASYEIDWLSDNVPCRGAATGDKGK